MCEGNTNTSLAASSWSRLRVSSHGSTITRAPCSAATRRAACTSPLPASTSRARCRSLWSSTTILFEPGTPNQDDLTLQDDNEGSHFGACHGCAWSQKLSQRISRCGLMGDRLSGPETRRICWLYRARTEEAG